MFLFIQRIGMSWGSIRFILRNALGTIFNREDANVNRPYSDKHRRSIAFFTVPKIHIPYNLREYYLSHELIKRGWKVSWLLPTHGQNDALKLSWPMKRYYPLDFKGHKFIFPIYLSVMLRLSSINVIWISGWSQRDIDALLWFVRILKMFGIRIVYDPIDPIDIFNEAQQPGDPKQNRAAVLMSTIYQLCDIIFCVTPEIRNLILRKGVSPKKVFVARWGTDISLFERTGVQVSFREELGLDEQTFLVGWVGLMNPFKGLAEIVIPLIEVMSPKYSNIHFVIAGYGRLETHIKRWIQQNSGMPVTLLGRIPYNKAPSFTSALDAYLVPTDPSSEFARSICPVKCFDAIAMGTDLIVTRTDATRILLSISEKVHLCDFNIDSFRRALEELYDTRDDRKPGNKRHRPEQTNIYPFSHQYTSKSMCDVFDQHL